MQVILIQDVDNLGGRNELVNVKNGYARNFLIPQKLAVEGTPSNLKKLEESLKIKAKKEAAMLAEIKQVIAVITASPLKLGAKVGTTGKIFGSVTSLQIAKAIRDQKGYEIDRKRITLNEDPKELGTFKATINFGNDTITEVEFEIVAE